MKINKYLNKLSDNLAKFSFLYNTFIKFYRKTNVTINILNELSPIIFI